MEIGAVNHLTNLSFSQASAETSAEEAPLNAFGIGAANAPEVELSPQARILQQTEQAQQERASSLQQNSAEPAEDEPELTGNEFVRVSSSVGSTARNNLSTERATEVYQQIQDLL